MENINLPEGLTIEMLDDYARKRENARRRADYRKHPERAKRNRISAARNLLQRNGYFVAETPGTGLEAMKNILRQEGYIVMSQRGFPPLPWNDLQGKMLLEALIANIRQYNRGGGK